MEHGSAKTAADKTVAATDTRFANEDRDCFMEYM
jgi:hypothetical protein